MWAHDPDRPRLALDRGGGYGPSAPPTAASEPAAPCGCAAPAARDAACPYALAMASLGRSGPYPHPCLLHRTELLGNIRQHQPESLLSCIEDPHATQRFAPCPTSQPALHFFNFLPPKRKDCVKTPLLYQVQCSHTHLSHSHTDKPNRTKSRSWAGQFISRSPAAPACGCAASSSRARSA